MSEEGQVFIKTDSKDGYIRPSAFWEDVWGNQDGWEDQPDGTKRRELVTIKGRKKPWGDFAFVASRDKDDNMRFAIEFPDLGKRFVVPCVEEDLP